MDLFDAMLGDAAIVRAFEAGQRAARLDQSRQSNPYRPASEEELWCAWDAGYAEEAVEYVAMASREAPEGAVKEGVQE